MKHPTLNVWLIAVAMLVFMNEHTRTTAAEAAKEENTSGRKTVQQRLEQYGPAARARLKPFFARQHISYPPAKLVLVCLKQEKLLEIYATKTNGQMTLVCSYPVLAASGKAGPKLREGDRQVPEGIYDIESLNPNSRYHLALRIDYPNAFDREQARKEKRTNLGGDIMIHGKALSIGCLAMGDEAAEELFVLAADTGLKGIGVILAPLDFRKHEDVPGRENLPLWVTPLYEQIRAELSKLSGAKK